MKSQVIYTICIYFLLKTIALAQTQTVQVPKIIPPSPTAQTFMRYGEIPVDYSTGVPNINIPIYTIEGKQLTIPISISYHASGIKVNDIASEVGLGWALNAGGLVSRTVCGIRDEDKGSIRTYFNSQQIIDALNDPSYYVYDFGTFTGITRMEHYFMEKFDNEEDSMSDRYFYRFPNGVSGIFRYDFNSLSDDENDIITLPYRPFKIKKFISVAPSQSKNIDRFEITDDRGTVYIFKSYLVGAPRNLSEWFLTKMTSADGTEVITFNYTLQQLNSGIRTDSQLYYGKIASTATSSCITDNNSILSDSFTPGNFFSTPILESIVSSNTIVKFYYNSDRQDFNYLQRLARVTVAPLNFPQNIVKDVEFVPTYFGSNPENKRLGLDKVIVNLAGNPEKQTYSFVYESQVLPAYPYKMTSKRYNEDFWGYNNGSNSKGLIESDFITNTFDRQAYGGDRDPDPTGIYAKACMLKEVKYPTGGRTVFEFERPLIGNVYTYKTNRSGYVGGFRVKKITNYTNNSDVANIKTYEYGGYTAPLIYAELFKYNQIYRDTRWTSNHEGIISSCQTLFNRDLLFSNSFLPLEVAPGMPIMYRKVTEYEGEAANNKGKTVYHYSEPYTPAGYQSNNPENYEFPLPRYCHPYHYDKGNYVPHLTYKIIYSNDGTSYRRVQEEVNTYSELFTETYNTGIKLTRPMQYATIDFYNGIMCLPSDPLASCSMVFIEHKASINVKDTKAYQQAALLTNNKTYVYSPDDENKFVLTSTDYIYNDNNALIKEKITLSSSGETLKTEYKYPFDLVNVEQGSFMQQLVTANRISDPVITSTYNGAEKLSENHVKFGKSALTGNILLPVEIHTKKGSGTIDIATSTDARLLFKRYNTKGNLLEYQMDGGTITTVLYGYNNQYPIAKIEGSGVSNIAAMLGKTIESINENDLHAINTLRLNTPYLISTYTYSPLIGMTSSTDPKGNKITYEYDGFGRLKAVRDHEGNLLSENRYNYRPN